MLWRVSIAILLCVNLAPARAANILPNGDFSAGNTGFLSGYAYTNPFFGIGTYSVGPVAPNGYRDHTTGTGNMLMADSVPAAGVPVWQVSVPVTPATRYNFSGSGMTWTPNDTRPANLKVTINDSVTGAAQFPRTAGVWFPFSFEWDSGPSSNALIKLVNLQATQLDNDFAIDDLALSAVPEPSSTALLAASALIACRPRPRRRPLAADR